MVSGRNRTGVVGTYYAAAQLSQRGWDVSLTLGNTPRTDLLAQHGDDQRLIGVQCKTSTGPGGFLLGRECEHPSPAARDEWFILIALPAADVRPDFFIIPRDVVAAYIWVSHRAWLQAPKADGTARKDSTMRNLERAIAEPYRERWDLLDAAASSAPAWLPDEVFTWAEQVRLPPGHPGISLPSDGEPRPPAPPWLALPPG